MPAAVAPSPLTEAQVPARDLIARIAAAEHGTVFAGYKTTFSGPDGEGRRTRMRVARHPTGRTFLEWESGGRSGRQWVYRSRHRWIDDPSLLLESYDVVPAAEADECVAWRTARRVEIVPRRPDRPSMSLLVDEATSLVLGETIRDSDGVQRFSWRFDTIEFDPAELPGDADEAEPVAAPEDTSVVLADGWQRLDVVAVPEGFREVASEPLPRGGERVYYSDGLAAFSVLQRPASGLAAGSEGEVVRQSCAGRARVTGTFGGVEVEVSGLLLPVAELELVVTGLHSRP